MFYAVKLLINNVKIIKTANFVSVLETEELG